MRFAALGPLEASGENGPLPLGGPKQRVVFAHLLLRANQVLPVEHLIDAVWGEDPPETARGTLQSYVSRLRSVLGAARIEGRGGGYVLRADPGEIDLLRFEELVREARREVPLDPEAAARLLQEAEELWRGDPLADVSTEPSLAADVTRLTEMRLAATEDRIACELELGRHSELVAPLERLTAVHPLRERLWGHLLLALYRAGRQAEALVAFQRAREVLADELGADPSKELQLLHERILRQDETLDLGGERLRGYRLFEEVGEGAFGTVYRALQPQVGREVAVKVIHPRYANDPGFVRRFEAEAQMVARLEHPHVVPLYDYWRDADGTYLVMRFMRGGSLREALASGPLERPQALRVVEQIAQALAAAHRQGVVHRDVKPENVLLDEEGNAYLSDFGIARELAGTETAPPGTSSPYLSPEQVRGEPGTPASDIYALGVVLREALDGQTAGTVGEVVARATAADAALRFPDAPSLAASLRAALGASGRAIAAEPAATRNPYKGLRPFVEADASDFFGRESLVERLVDRLAEETEWSRFLVVIGPSGSGKSSVVRAGLVPALRKGALEGSARWFYVEMAPGAHPLEELEAALLRVAVSPPPSLIEQLERDEHGLLRSLKRVLPDDDSELVLVVDQLEELFTLTEDKAVRRHFLDSLRMALADPRSRLRVVSTLRADFYDRPLAQRGSAELLRSRAEAVLPLSPEELERAVAGPAELAGVIPEPGLVADIVADVADQPGALPLLQHALTELFERRRDGLLTVEAYREIGRASGALARRAEQLYGAMSESGAEAARQLFLRLATLGEGTADTRRRVPLSELSAIEVDQRALGAVLEAYGRYRLLTFDRDPATREPTVEIAHEALLGAWGRLRGWIDDAREDVRLHRRFAESATEWERSGREPSFLLRGARLDQAERWAVESELALTRPERAFITAGVELRHAEAEAETQRAERERLLQRRSLRRARALVAVLAAAVLVAGTLTVVATGQGRRAEREARIAASRELAAASIANLDVDPERSILLALQALEATRADGTFLQEAEEALHAAVRADRLILTIRNPSTANVAWSPDGNLLATGGTAGGTIQHDAMLWDARTGSLIHRLSGHAADVTGVAFDPDGSRLVTGADDGRAIVWDTATGRQLLSVAGGTKRDSVLASFSPDGGLVAIGEIGEAGKMTIVDADTGDMVRRFPGSFCMPSFSPDGTRITAGCSEDLTVFDVATGREVLTIAGAGAGGVVYSPDGSRLATGCCQGSATIWDAQTGRKLLSLEGHTGDVIGIAWSADGTLLATGGTDGTARVWDASTGKQLVVLAGHAGLVAMVDFSPDGTRLLTGGGDGTARVWDVTRTGGAEWLAGAEPTPLSNVAYSPNGSSVLTAGWPGAGWLWDSSTGERVRNHPDIFYGGSFGPSGSTITGAGWSAESGFGVRILSAATGRETGFLEVRCCPAVATSPDGSEVATGLADGSVVLWDFSSGERLRKLPVLPEHVQVHVADVAFSPDGTLVAGIAQDTLRVWEVTTGREVFGIQATSGLSWSIAFSPDGGMIATSGGDGAAIWSSSTGDRVVALTGAGTIRDVAFSDDGALVATAGDDGAARIWDVASGRQTLSLGGRAPALNAVAFSPDGTKLATAGDDGILRVYVLDLSELIRIARSRLTRGFTESECRQYLHVAACPPSVSRLAPPPPGPGVGLGLEGPEGAYRLEIARRDLSRSPTPRNADAVGDLTLSIVDGAWRLHQERPNGETFDTSGTYSVSGDEITFTDGGDQWCFGRSWSGRWSLRGIELSITNVSSGCRGPHRLWVETVFGTFPWVRVNHHALGG